MRSQRREIPQEFGREVFPQGGSLLLASRVYPPEISRFINPTAKCFPGFKGLFWPIKIPFLGGAPKFRGKKFGKGNFGGPGENWLEFCGPRLRALFPGNVFPRFFLGLYGFFGEANDLRGLGFLGPIGSLRSLGRSFSPGFTPALAGVNPFFCPISTAFAGDMEIHVLNLKVSPGTEALKKHRGILYQLNEQVGNTNIVSPQSGEWQIRGLHRRAV